MALKYKYKSKDEIPPDLQPSYVERDGAFVLDVEGIPIPDDQAQALEEARAESTRIAAERDALTQRLATLQIDQGVVAAATRRGLRPTATRDIQARARAELQLLDGSPVVMSEDGKTPRLGKDRKSPMSIDEWVEAQVADAPHLFEGNAGSGAAGNPARPGARAATTKNPYLKGTWNLTRQGILEKEDPEEARRLMAEAGVRPQ